MKQTYTTDDLALVEEAETLFANMAAAFCFYQEQAMTMSAKLRRLRENVPTTITGKE